LLAIVQEKVKPEREKQNRESRKKFWWHYGEKTSALYHAIGRGDSFAKHAVDNGPLLEKVLVITLHTKYFQPILVDNVSVYSHALAVFSLSDAAKIALLYSSFAQIWVWTYGSSIGTGLRFTPSDCYETFPFPYEMNSELGDLGEQYDALRREIMNSHDIGLTPLYNMFHNPDETDEELEDLRLLQKQLDEAVLDSYGWNDIDLDHGFHEAGYLPANDNVRYTISEPARIEILRRLALLNRQRWQEEQEK